MHDQAIRPRREPVAPSEPEAGVQGGRLRLSAATPGAYRCVQIDRCDDSITRMKQLGLCEGRRIDLLATGNPMILRLGVSEIGLSGELAGVISVVSIGGSVLRDAVSSRPVLGAIADDLSEKS